MIFNNLQLSLKVPKDTKIGLRANRIECNSGPEPLNIEKQTDIVSLDIY